jgi:hypothetical protein
VAKNLQLHQFYQAMAWLGEPLPDDVQAGATPFAPRLVKDLIEEGLFQRRTRSGEDRKGRPLRRQMGPANGHRTGGRRLRLGIQGIVDGVCGKYGWREQ